MRSQIQFLLQTSPPDQSIDQPQPSEVTKIGEYQSETHTSNRQGLVATVQAHEWNLRPAATLYIRNIPILTFTTTATPQNILSETTTSENGPGKSGQPASLSSEADSLTSTSDDPLQRASTLAAQLNQLDSYAFDSSTIMVRWDGGQERYIIGTEELDLVAMDAHTILPDTTNDIAQDALQATNRLRRQLGNAPPVSTIVNAPQPERVAVRTVKKMLQGMASWYGPGFHGRLTANGEIYDKYQMTAAHPSLPFNTQVLVTNQNTGLSTIVRINDRGPYAGGRIIDLSEAAAYAVGMVSSGVAPVTVEILTPVR
ncbi:MAG: septal ring lytic transglycosylase RlpA family protein [Oscillatoriales cyanobacterium SM2_3_0]|nr:septal ring lytic transglycosylase RlpA family protein [Oscillatoriales cyanobacterium SM2_3_0]